MRYRFITIMFSLASVFLVMTCSKESETPTESSGIAMDGLAMHSEAVNDLEQDARPEMARAAAPVAQAGAQNAPLDARQPAGPEKPAGPAAFPGKAELPAVTIGRDRLLEYTVNLQYRTGDLSQSRSELYKIIARYGFLNQSSTGESDRLTHNSQFRVRATDLLEVIDQLKAVGELESESITTTDHTENMAWQERRARREAVRSERRKTGPVTAASWDERENLISQSEDTLDQAAHEKWKIQDRVAWANFSVTLQGPQAPAKIEVPRFENALVGMLNWLMALLYGLIYIAPVVAIAGGLAWLIRRRRRAAATGA